MAPAWRNFKNIFLLYVLDLIDQLEGKTDVWISQVRRVKAYLSSEGPEDLYSGKAKFK